MVANSIETRGAFRQLTEPWNIFGNIMEVIGTAMDGVGVFLSRGAHMSPLGDFCWRAHSTGNYYALYRQDVVEPFCLGLEFLIAGDIIRTVLSRLLCKMCWCWD